MLIVRQGNIYEVGFHDSGSDSMTIEVNGLQFRYFIRIVDRAADGRVRADRVVALMDRAILEFESEKAR